MVDGIVTLALRQRFMILLLALLISAAGLWCIAHTNVDAFPDVTNVQVEVGTEAPGLAAEEVEKLVTLPIETEMGGLPGVSRIRSISKFGLSVVTVVFTDNTDIYWARQQVFEK